MSLSYQPLTPVCVRDPRTKLESERSYAVLKCGSQTTWKAYTTTSISSSSLQFSCPPPSGNVIVDRKMYLYVPVRLTYTSIPPTGITVLQANRDAPRAFPLASSIDTFSATINNQSVSINIADIIHALMHYNTDNELKNLDYSMTPSYQDQSQVYSDLYGTIRSPLFNYGDANDGDQCPRGGFPFKIIQNDVGDGTNIKTAIIDVAFCEPLYLPPFYFGASNGCGFFNVNTLDFNITFLSQSANRMWSHDDSLGNVFLSSQLVFGGVNGGPATSSFAVNLGSQPQMLIQFITPQENQIIPANMPITYPYFDVLRFPTDLSSFAPNVTNTVNSNNIQLNSVPRRLYVFVRERNSDLFSNCNHTDSFFQINQISFQFLNKNGLLASASMSQLYEMSVKNHCKLSWNQWSGGPVYKPADFTATYGTVGSVLCIEFATDIGLDSLMAPGILNQCQLQVQLTITNVSSRTINPTMYIVPILEGTFTVQGMGMASINVGVISPSDVLDCQENASINYSDVEAVSGGDFFTGLKAFGAKLLPYLQQAHDFIKQNKLLSQGLSYIPHPLGQAASTAANVLGYGDGGDLVGGAHLSRRSLHNRLRR